MAVVIYHNPRCSKSRQALTLLEQEGVQPVVIEYLKTPPSEAELDRILTALGKQPEELLRKGEDEYKAYFQGRKLSRAEMIALMVKYPKVIERPIVVNGDRAALGRPPEDVLEVI